MTLFVDGDVLGETRLNAVVYPSDVTYPMVRWESSDEQVVVVDGYGNLTARRPGSAIVTATSGDFSFSARVTVISLVTRIELSHTDVNLNIRGSMRDSLWLRSGIFPHNASDRRLIWSSSNPVVASVDGTGVVTAGSSGSAVITVTSHDGRVTQSVSVTVRCFCYG